MVTTLYGHGGVGKSMLALELALMLASGNDWLGFKALVDDGGAVMYVDFEMHYRVQAKRIAMIAGYAIPKRFFLVNPHNLDSDSLLYRELLHYKPSLVVIDSFSAYVGGKDTTKEDVVVPAIRKLQKFAEQANCAVLIVDHVTKNDAANDATTPYGSVYKHNLVRMAWYVRDIEPNLLEITRTKNNLQDSTTVERTFQVRRRTNEHGYLWHERCAVPEGGRRGAIVRYLRTVGDVGATTKEIADYLEEEGYEVHQRTVQRDLQTMNIVIADGNARNTRYRLRNNHTEGGNHAEW
jgi:RecA-family ATPase